MYNIKFPREIANPKRHPVANEERFLKFVNANIASSDLYTDVYNFTDFRPPYMYPIYESAIIDRVYFDFDQKVRINGEWVQQPAYENMLKLHEACMKKGFMHLPRFTGSGYDTIVLTNPDSDIKNKKVCVWDAVLYLSEKLGFIADPQTKDVLPRIRRITNTFNHKPTARRFCIPLDSEIIYIGEKNIREIAKKQHFANNLYGDKFWDITQWDAPESKFQKFLPDINIKINEEDFADLNGCVTPCIKNLLSRGDLGWQERRDVILFLRDNCYLLDETIALLKKYLSKKKFIHCVRDEKQPNYLYRNEQYMFPHQKELIDLQACPHEAGTYCPKAKFGCLNYGRAEEQK